MGKGALENSDHKDRFERAKAFSDYLNFHIRSAFFLLVGIFLLAIPASKLVMSVKGGFDYRPSEFLLEISLLLFCFSLAGTMLYHIFGVGRTFLRIYVKQVAIRRLLVYPLYWCITILTLFAISYEGASQFAALADLDIGQIVCDLNYYLSQTNYLLTPEKPVQCP